jgi:hypothetical protein
MANFKTRWLLNALLGTSLSVVGLGCDDDAGDDDTSPLDSGVGDASLDASDAKASPADSGGGGDSGDGTADPACLASVYSELDTACKTCVCVTKAASASICDGPCWEFLACSLEASSAGGGCAQYALGTTEQQGCIQTVCAKELSGPGVGPKASAFSQSGITAACVATIPGRPAPACASSLEAIRK